MSQTKSGLIAVLLTASCALSVAAQSFVPKNFLFKGDPAHTDAELTAAAGLRKGVALTAAEMNDHTKLLMDTSLFTNITYTFNGQDLTFNLTPATDLLPIRLENFPIAGGKALEDSLRAHVPLYHGAVPGDGGLLDSVRNELQAELATKGIQANVSAVPYQDRKLGKVTAISFSISTPMVDVGEIKLDGASAAMDAKARLTAAKAVGSTYNLDGSASQLETSLGNLYREQGYLEAQVQATPLMQPVVEATSVHIPFTVKVDEGPQYKLGNVQLAPDMVVTQAAFDKQATVHPGEVALPQKIREEWNFLGRQYHNRGYMRAKIMATPTYDHANSTVSYAVTAEPGPVYTMGMLKVDNVADDVILALKKAWTVPQGAPFNEGAIIGLGATTGVNPAFERFMQTVKLSYTLQLHDDTHTVDLNLKFEKKP
jgi:outer membrane protein assembly factor BamA